MAKTASTWNVVLNKVLNKTQKDIRPELVSGLEEILKHRKKEVGSFSGSNILPITHVIIRDKDRTSLLPEAFCDDLIRPMLAAVYLANCNYFHTDADFANDKVIIRLLVTDTEPATYSSEQGKNKHLITIPTWKFKSWSQLLFSMDAESRHAVHNNFLYQKGLVHENRANRAYLVISETIDEGQVFTDKLPSTPQYDPFLNEMALTAKETNGHNGAKYFCRYFLEVDSAQRRQQLNWLIRLKLRENFPENEASKLLKKKLEEIVEMANNNGKPLETPYNKTIDPLLDFYKGTVATTDLTGIRARLDDTRTVLLQYFPFYPEKPEIILVGGKPVNQFATVLDYVALKLKYTPPQQLAQEVGL